jgi:hypothetical protein
LNDREGHKGQKAFVDVYVRAADADVPHPKQYLAGAWRGYRRLLHTDDPRFFQYRFLHGLGKHGTAPFFCMLPLNATDAAVEQLWFE